MKNIFQALIYTWKAQLFSSDFTSIPINEHDVIYIDESSEVVLILNSHTRFIIKGKMLEIAQMVSLYL